PLDDAGPGPAERQLQRLVEDHAAGRADPEEQRVRAVAREPEERAGDEDQRRHDDGRAERRDLERGYVQRRRGDRFDPEEDLVVDQDRLALEHGLREVGEADQGGRGDREPDDQDEPDRGVDPAHERREPPHQREDRGLDAAAAGPPPRGALDPRHVRETFHAGRAVQPAYRGGVAESVRLALTWRRARYSHARVRRGARMARPARRPRTPGRRPPRALTPRSRRPLPS